MATDRSLREDLAQEIITRLLSEKMPRIRDRFDAGYSERASFTSYFMVIIRNTHYDVLRESKYRMLDTLDERDEPHDPSAQESLVGRIVFKEEFAKLKAALDTYPRTRGKLECGLRLKYRLPLSVGLLCRWWPRMDEDAHRLQQDHRRVQDHELWAVAAEVLHCYETPPVKGDSLRKWVDVRVAELIRLMNRTHPHTVYDHRNFETLFAHYVESEYAT